ncbi:hypothetical protein [Motilimonas pumila]|uniref:Uncharacterized protein n=1 Tax=Motilimonas pumila TaxID=2303987 RepID=A0A418YB02_9GAMM|nr:hypothetical protein [Motilimonas pumila]RJG40157.1 hypothetical protein D1Z90_17070 [Motilimonas pumila]
MKLELKRILQILFVLTILGAAFIYRTYQGEPVSDQPESNSEPMPEVALCDFAKGCVIHDAAGDISAQLQAGNEVLAETPFNLTLTLPEGAQLKSANITGHDMFMGKIPVKFNKLENNQQYLAEAMVGACVTERMRWNLALEIQPVQGELIAKQFVFEIERHY